MGSTPQSPGARWFERIDIEPVAGSPSRPGETALCRIRRRPVLWGKDLHPLRRHGDLSVLRHPDPLRPNRPSRHPALAPEPRPSLRRRSARTGVEIQSSGFVSTSQAPASSPSRLRIPMVCPPSLWSLVTDRPSRTMGSSSKHRLLIGVFAVAQPSAWLIRAVSDAGPLRDRVITSRFPRRQRADRRDLPDDRAWPSASRRGKQVSISRRDRSSRRSPTRSIPIRCASIPKA